MIVSRILVQRRLLLLCGILRTNIACVASASKPHNTMRSWKLNRHKLTFRGLLLLSNEAPYCKRTNTNFDVLLLFLRTPFPFLGYFTCFVFSSSISSMISSSSVRSNVKLACKLREYAKATYPTQNAHKFA